MMSALPPKADMCSAQARFVPIADIAKLVGYLVGGGYEAMRNGETESFGGP
jgi:hypothetical protein